jgi:hypothetical protein
MNCPLLLVLVTCLAGTVCIADDASFQRIMVPDGKGNAVKAVLTFRDANQAVEIQPVKGAGITIPYGEIDKFAYEYTKKHHISEGTLATAPVGVGLIAMIRKSRSHWLEIDYTDQGIRKLYVIRMDKHNYLRILEAVKAHTGKDAEILGNADKRGR